MKICSMVGDVIRLANPKFLDGENFLRVQVSIDISLPLCRCLMSLNNEKQVWASFKYERLLNICYWCGRLTHNGRDCELWIESERTLHTQQKEFGPGMRAAPFVASRNNVIAMLGFYTSRKNHALGSCMEYRPMNGDESIQPAETTVPEQPPRCKECYTNLEFPSSMCNGNFETNPPIVSVLDLSHQLNPENHGIMNQAKVSETQLNEAALFESHLKEIDEGLTKFSTTGPSHLIFLGLNHASPHLL